MKPYADFIVFMTSGSSFSWFQYRSSILWRFAAQSS